MIWENMLSAYGGQEILVNGAVAAYWLLLVLDKETILGYVPTLLQSCSIYWSE